jgi:hypothetical protein
MRMPKPAKETELTSVAISVEAFEAAVARRAMSAMEAFMCADSTDEAAAQPTQRAA